MRKSEQVAHNIYVEICGLLDIEVAEVTFLKRGWWNELCAHGYRLDREGRSLFVAVYSENYEGAEADVEIFFYQGDSKVHVRDILAAARYLGRK